MVMLLAAIPEPPSQQVILQAMPAAMAIPMAPPPSQQVMPLAILAAMAIPVALPPSPQVMPLATVMAMAIPVALPPSQQVMPLPETESETEMQSIKVKVLEEANRRRRWPEEILQLANQSITF